MGIHQLMKPGSLSKKPEKEMRVSDWLTVKAAVKSSDHASNPELSLASMAAPKTPALNDNGGNKSSTVDIAPPADKVATARPAAPRVQPAQSTILEPPRHFSGLGAQPQRASMVAEAPPVAPPAVETTEVQPLPFDIFRILGGVLERRRMIAFWALTGLFLGFSFGFLHGNTYQASMVLMVRDVPTSVPVESGHVYRPKTFDKSTLRAILTSEELYRRLAPKLKPAAAPREIENYLDYSQTRDSDCIELIAKGASSAEDAVHNVNTWADELLVFTQELQSRETKGTQVYLQRESIEESINAATAELTALRSKYSDENPLVREKVAQIDWLKGRLTEISEGKKPQASSQSELEKMTGYFSVMSPATVEGTDSKSRWFKGAVAGGAAFMALFMMGFLYALGKEIVDHTLRTPSELEYAVHVPKIQKIPHLGPESLGSAEEVSSLWTRIVGSSPHELVCFWTPFSHKQPHMVMQALMNLASKRCVPLVWVETEGETVRPPADFQQVDLSRLSQPLDSGGRYWLKLQLSSMSAMEAEHVGAALVNIASRHRIPVWLGIQGHVAEPGTSLARHAHRVKILATLGVAKRDFWQNQGELLKQSVKTPIEWLAVNHIPWYRW